MVMQEMRRLLNVKVVEIYLSAVQLLPDDLLCTEPGNRLTCFISMPIVWSNGTVRSIICYLWKLLHLWNQYNTFLNTLMLTLIWLQEALTILNLPEYTRVTILMLPFHHACERGSFSNFFQDTVCNALCTALSIR